MPSKDVPFLIDNFLGINRRDGADLISNREFETLQNWIHTTKGLLFKRYGSTADLSASDLLHAYRVNGLWRHYSVGDDRFTLYHCKPDNTTEASPTQDMTLTEVSGGDLFNGGAVETLRFAYSWVGKGGESSYNSQNRAGYVSAAGTHAWDQVGHQSITLSANTKAVQVTMPTFPSWVTSANIFMARGSSTELVYVGSVYTSGGSLTVKHYIGPSAAYADATPTVSLTPAYDAAGNLKTGVTYYVSVAWIVNTDQTENPSGTVPSTFTKLSDAVSVSMQQSSFVATQNAIQVIAAGTYPSTNGAAALYVFIGLKSEKDHPMMYVGSIKSGETLTIKDIPVGGNAASHPCNLAGASDTAAYFMGRTWEVNHTANKFRPGFMLRKDQNGTVKEVLISRSAVATQSIINFGIMGAGNNVNPFTNSVFDPYLRNNYIHTGHDYDSSGSLITSYKVPTDPIFTSLLGLTYWCDGVTVPYQTDGYTVGVMIEKFGTILPGVCRSISRYKDGLVYLVPGSNQVFGSNALQPRNFASGGTGTSLRFVTAGDPYGDGVACGGTWSYGSQSDGPQSWYVAFKKSSCWAIRNIPDLSSGVPYTMEELSGRVGCIAPKSVVSTPIGTMFLGQDGIYYLIRGIGDPLPVGQKISPVFQHLIGDDDLMGMVTAVYHHPFLKVSYPSTSDSTYNDAQIYVDLRTQDGQPLVWSGPHTGINVGGQIVLSGDGDDNSRLCVLGDALGTAKLDDESTFQDLGTTISSVATWKTTRFGAPAHNKRIMGMIFDAYYDTAYTHELLLQGYSGEDYSQVRKQLSNGGAVWDSSNWDVSVLGLAAYQSVPMMFGDSNLVGRTFKWSLTHANNAQMVLASALIDYKPERRLLAS